MNQEDTGAYIKGHLGFAGRADPLFFEDAITVIHQASRGYPRTISNLALAALVATRSAKARSWINPQRNQQSVNSASNQPGTTDDHAATMTTNAPPRPTRRGVSTPRPSSNNTTVNTRSVPFVPTVSGQMGLGVGASN